ncbi:MAG: class I SAM-dependent methyltransferase [Patescibacteria group bacterium]
MSIFVDPRKAIEALSLSSKMQVADVGCGVGHYTLALADKIQGEGTVYAIDVRKNVLEKVASEAKERGVSNIEVIWGDAEKEGGTRLANDSVGAVVASNIFFQTEDKEALAKEIARITASDGEILIIDWINSFGGLGPPEDYIVSAERVKEICEPLGLVFQREHKTGAHHYELLFKKS